jgi:hypothetical protein
LAGLAVFVLVCGSWLALVLMRHRDEFVEKMLQRELVSQVVNDGGKYRAFQRVWLAPVSTFIDFLPWSICGIAALAKALRHRAANDGRSIERYLACWFVVGLVLFAVAAHQRGRLTWPLIPALALLAGHQLDLWTRKYPHWVLSRWAGAVAILAVCASVLNHQVFLGYSARCQQTLAMRQLARLLKEKLGEKPPVTYVDAPFAVQFYLGYLRFNARVSNAVSLLEATNSAYVVTSGQGAKRIVGGSTNQVFTLFAWPTNKEPVVELLSNRREFAIH